MVPAKKPTYCPYKEYWFGPGEEAQTKPAGFKFKRGTLLQVRKGYLTRQYQSADAGTEMTVPWSLKEEDTVVFLIGYDSTFAQHRVTDPVTYKSQYVEAVQHQFTFLVGEKMETLILSVWGRYYPNRHNEMWRKAHKVLKHPAKKPKKHPKGFCFDD